MSLTSATQFLQYSAVAESLPPSLQVPLPTYITTSGIEQIRSAADDPAQFGFSAAQFSPSADLLHISSPYMVAQLEQQFSQQATAINYSQLQRAATSPLASEYSGSSPMALSRYSAGVSPTARFSQYASPGSPASQSSGMLLSSAAQFPGPGSPQQAPTKIFSLVEFKRGRTVQYQSSFWAQPGVYLLVEGDEGEDMGMAVNTWVGMANSPPVVNNSLNTNKSSGGRDIDPVTGDPIYPKVIRQATPKEVQYMHNAQAQAELKCTELAKQKVIEHQLSMVVVDSEFQFDRKKLTFYYDASERVDFRDLIRDLYKVYRARIWMSKIRPQ